jgi:hypothetical protein
MGEVPAALGDLAALQSFETKTEHNTRKKFFAKRTRDGGDFLTPLSAIMRTKGPTISMEEYRLLTEAPLKDFDAYMLSRKDRHHALEDYVLEHNPMLGKRLERVENAKKCLSQYVR